MRADKFRDLDTAELTNQLRESEDQMFRFRFQLGMGQMEGLKKFRELKKDRARMLGVLRQRELEGAGKGK
jgi:large subunit ribosomal protein L29